MPNRPFNATPRRCFLTAQRVIGTWGFMGSYKWGYKSPTIGYENGYPTYNPLITTHEPPSTVAERMLQAGIETVVASTPLLRALQKVTTRALQRSVIATILEMHSKSSRVPDAVITTASATAP